MKTMVDNAKIARMEKNIKETDAKVKNIKSVPPSTTADAGKVLTVNEDGSLSWQQKGAGGGMKAYFAIGGKIRGRMKNLDGVVSFEDTAGLTDLSALFKECYLNEAPLLDTNAATNLQEMFRDCSYIQIIPAYDVSNATNLLWFVMNNYKLKEIKIKNIGADLDIKFSNSDLFTREALLEIIGNLKTVTSTKTLTMGATNLAKLTDEDKAIATNKGWTLA